MARVGRTFDVALKLEEVCDEQKFRGASSGLKMKEK